MRERADRPARFGRVHATLHWLMAALIITMLAVGFWMHGLPLGADKLRIYGLHKSTGLLILWLAAFRLCWRLTHAVPPLPEDMPRWMRLGAHASHIGLYALMFAMPVSGWLMSAAAGMPVSFYGLFVVPSPLGADPAVRGFMHEAHEWLAWALIALIAAHAGAALYHHFIRKDDTLKRMLRCRTSSS